MAGTKPGTGQAGAAQVRWDTSQMKSGYANVCNATGTREEVVLYFGISHPAPSGEAEFAVQVSDRIILSPFAAKRLAQLLGNVVQAYESRFGVLPTGADAPGSAAVPEN